MLQRLSETRAVLETYQQLAKEAFLGNRAHQSAVKYELLTAIQLCLDLGAHLLSSLGAAMPADYADTFRRLGEEGVITSGFAQRLGRMARFRNLLVHLYWQVDHQRVWEILQNDVGDFANFAQAIADSAARHGLIDED